MTGIHDLFILSQSCNFVESLLYCQKCFWMGIVDPSLIMSCRGHGTLKSNHEPRWWKWELRPDAIYLFLMEMWPSQPVWNITSFRGRKGIVMYRWCGRPRLVVGFIELGFCLFPSWSLFEFSMSTLITRS